MSSSAMTGICPNCGKDSSFAVRRKETREPHGERTYQEWYECCFCRDSCTEDEIEQPEEESYLEMERRTA